ncbi:MAG TPA: class I SAM-dependent methyltransferase [Candidatus Limnocylindrales bacterium]|nr:class I SAM-dependent methyltransferase [Candidatus Limnocylindrales bacterium]
MTLRGLALVAIGAATLAAGRGAAVRAIRAVDHRGGLFSRRGARSYAGWTRFFSGFYRHVAADAAAKLGDRDATVIDIGPGPGDLLVALRAAAPMARLTGVEPSSEMRAIAAERGLSVVDGRAEALPFRDASVDLVLSTLSSHHWDDAVAAFGEIRRVLRPGGEARIYDLRFSGYSAKEARAFGAGLQLAAGAISHTVFDERLIGLRPYSLITIRI